MSREYLDFDGVPVEEKCEQVGPNCDYGKMRSECRALINQLERQFGKAIDHGARFKIASNPHDFGEYYSVQLIFDDENERAAEYAYRIESEFPERWDDAARAELSSGTCAHGVPLSNSMFPCAACHS